jgi:hypothetical protein
MAEGINIVIHSSDFALFAQKLRQDMNQIRASGGQESVNDAGTVTI